jgi:transcription elongation GreA/GreB family factor
LPTVTEAHWLAEWDAVIAGSNAKAIEEFWLARLEGGVGDGAEFVEALKRLRSAGKKAIAATLLEVAAAEAKEEGAWEARKRFLCELVRLGIGSADEGRAELEECVRRLWVGRPSLDKLLKRFSLASARKPLETLETLEAWLAHDVGGVFAMAGRGPGRVVEANPQLGMLRLDFEKEKHVPVPIDAARKYLAPLPPGHFLRRRLEEKATLTAEVARDPQGSLAAILEGADAAMSVPEIKAALTGLLPEDQWSSWWNRAKKNPRLMAVGSGSRVQYRLAGDQGAEEEIRAEFASAPPARQVELARRHAARNRDLGAFMGAELLRRAAAPDVEPEVAWEALAIAARTGADGGEVHAAREAVLSRAGANALLELVSDATQREAVLEFVREHDPAGWVELFGSWLEKETSARLLGKVAVALVDAGATARVQSFVDQVLVQPGRFPAALVWVCEETDARLAAILDERRGGVLLVRLVELAERREFGPLRGRLKEVLSAGGLAERIVQERLAVDQGRRIVQILEHPGELADVRNWLRRAVTARFPELRSGVAVEDVVPALAGTVVRLQEELRDLLERQIPETLRAIQEARSHGDLTENFEYHAARARQEYLSARASDLQADLGRVRIVDPATVNTGQVRVGTRVRLHPQAGGEPRTVTILGPYEADPEKGILSHASEAGQALLEKSAGDTVTYDGASFTVASIERAL